jgi:hypothetical protein
MLNNLSRALLQALEAPEHSEIEMSKTEDGNKEDEFLTTLALEYSADDKTSGPVSSQLVY